jgi:5-methylcytosine-specific restriction enzyme A
MMYPKHPPIRLKGKNLYALYQAVFDRDNYTCQECGSNQIDKAPHHVLPKSRGGSDTADNLITLCLVCHGMKHGSNYII